MVENKAVWEKLGEEKRKSRKKKANMNDKEKKCERRKNNKEQEAVDKLMKMEKITEDNKFVGRKHWTSLQQLLMKKLI